MATTSTVRLLAIRPVIFGFAKLLMLALGGLPLASAAPATYIAYSEESPKPPSDPNLWLYLGVAAILVLSGGAFAGLTIALMGQVSLIFALLKVRKPSVNH